jgi:RNA polymerase sigma-70 factor, ECF subfamily
MTESRDRADFEDVYEEHVWTVFGFFGYRVRTRADAEDLTQLTFERALNAWERFDPERGTVGAWLMSIARNLLVDHYRRDRSLQREDIDQLEEAGTSPHVEGPESDLGISAELADALGHLTGRERELLALRYGAELSGREIAALTDLSLANVQQILSRTLRKLRDELAPNAEPASTS